MKPRDTLQNRALRLLARREHSRAELKIKLLAHGLPAEVEQLLDALQEKDWLSDKRFATEWVRQRSIRYGQQRLRHELQQKGIAPELIDATLANHVDNELTHARCVWQKKYGSHPLNLIDKAKQIRFLQYRGYRWDIIQQVLQIDSDA